MKTDSKQFAADAAQQYEQLLRAIAELRYPKEYRDPELDRQIEMSVELRVTRFCAEVRAPAPSLATRGICAPKVEQQQEVER